MGTRYVSGTHSFNGAQSDMDIGRDETYCDECNDPTDAVDLVEHGGEDLCPTCLDEERKHDYQHIPGRGMACTKCGDAWSRRASEYCTPQEES